MLTHYARTFDGLAYAQTLVDKLELREFLDAARIVRFGARSRPVRRYRARFTRELNERGLTPQSPEWIAAFDELLREQAREPVRRPASVGEDPAHAATRASIR